MNHIRTRAAYRRTLKASCRDRLINGAALYAIGFLIMLQTDEYGARLTEGYHGLNLVMLACFGLACLNWFRAARQIVGESA